MRGMKSGCPGPERPVLDRKRPVAAVIDRRIAAAFESGFKAASVLPVG